MVLSTAVVDVAVAAFAAAVVGVVAAVVAVVAVVAVLVAADSSLQLLCCACVRGRTERVLSVILM